MNQNPSIESPPHWKVECYYPSDESVQQLHVAVIHEDGLMSESIQENVHENLLWQKEAPKGSVVQAEDNLYSLTNDTVTKIAKNDEGQWSVAGQHKDSYATFKTTNAAGLAYYETGKVFGVIENDTGVRLYRQNADGQVTDTGFVSTRPGIKRITSLKSVNHRLMYGAEFESDNSIEHPSAIFDALKGSSIAEELMNSPEGTDLDFEDINVVENTADVDADMNWMTFSKTLAFDMDSEGWVLTVYEDLEGQVRMRLSKHQNFTTVKYGGLTPIPEGSYNFKDMKVYSPNAIQEYGKALLLDQASSKAMVIHFNTKFGLPKDVSLFDSVSLGENTHPVAMSFNADKSKAYIVNEDETVSVLSLLNADMTVKEVPTLIGNVNIKDFISDKQDIVIQPKGILFDHGKLIISGEQIKGQLIVDEATINSMIQVLPQRSDKVSPFLPLGSMILPVARKKRSLKKSKQPSKKEKMQQHSTLDLHAKIVTKGKKKIVEMEYKDFKKLTSLVEDAMAIKIYEERKKEPVLTLEQLKDNLKKDACL